MEVLKFEILGNMPRDLELVSSRLHSIGFALSPTWGNCISFLFIMSLVLVCLFSIRTLPTLFLLLVSFSHFFCISFTLHGTPLSSHQCGGPPHSLSHILLRFIAPITVFLFRGHAVSVSLHCLYNPSTTPNGILLPRQPQTFVSKIIKDQTYNPHRNRTPSIKHTSSSHSDTNGLERALRYKVDLLFNLARHTPGLTSLDSLLARLLHAGPSAAK